MTEEDYVIATRKMRVSREDMDRINASCEKWRELGLPEHDIKKYRDGLIKINGEWVKDTR